MGRKEENKEYSRTVQLTATELSLLWKATRDAKEKCQRMIKRQEQKKKEGKLEPGEYVPYELLNVYQSLEEKLNQTNLNVEDQVIDNIRKFHKGDDK
ncbi:hypothetical protein KSF_084180 [Reticulibacter mediterranei]|uniref:Uncharacterized protein n=1 Tax=Reticulibacter mediterranei TaxID=2778369 RepID=A0A8J3IWZ8_9CHLR|nr:hypothetical protein [Reticulibacter mediterranei]GHO98370.1 hypothetical protein KSF_084180 [Reticulibacter mediterranei]